MEDVYSVRGTFLWLSSGLSRGTETLPLVQHGNIGRTQLESNELNIINKEKFIHLIVKNNSPKLKWLL